MRAIHRNGHPRRRHGTRPGLRWMKQGLWCLGIVAAALLCAGCEGVQAMLDPRGREAGWIARLWWGMFAVAMTIFAVYLVLLAIGLFPQWFGRRDRPPALDDTYLIVGGGVILPVVVFIGLSVATVLGGRTLSIPQQRAPDEPFIEVTGHQWWWQVRYPGDGPHEAFTTANEVHVPVGTPVRIAVTTADVIHSFWVPNLHGKIDLVPGRTNVIRITAEEPGTYRGQCAQFCGAQHARMGLFVVAHPPDAYEAWLERQRQPARAPDDSFLERGRRAFLQGGCTFCHTVRGVAPGATTSAEAGPDLTHVGSRRSIGAGMFRPTRGNLQAWIVDNQNLKPGNHMPEYNHFSATDLRALAAYLESLK